MTERKATKNREKRDALRVAIRFASDAQYRVIHDAAERTGLSMNAWMVSTLLAAAGPIPKNAKPWKRQENRNRNGTFKSKENQPA